MQTGCLGVPEFLHQLQLQTQVKKEKITNRKSIEILIKEENNNKQKATYVGNSALALIRIKINLGKKRHQMREQEIKKCEKSNVMGWVFSSRMWKKHVSLFKRPIMIVQTTKSVVQIFQFLEVFKMSLRHFPSLILNYNKIKRCLISDKIKKWPLNHSLDLLDISVCL